LNIDASSKYREMVQKFSQETDRVSRLIADKLGKSLRIRLFSISFKTEPIDQAEFEEHISANIQKIKDKKDWRRDGEREEGGGTFCGMGTPKKVPYTESGTNYLTSPEKFQQFWLEQVEEWSKNSLDTIKLLIRDQVQDQVKGVTRKIEVYICDFEKQMAELLDEKGGSISDHQERLAILSQTQKRLMGLMDDLNADESLLPKG